MRAVVIGAGIIGLACAEELLHAGHDVTVFDADPAQGATHAAAGMLAPAGEAWYGEGELLGAGLTSAALWPGFAARLESSSCFDVDFRRTGTLLVGRDRDDLDTLLRTTGLLVSSGASVEGLGRAETLAREPTLNPRIAGGAFLPDDHHVNPRKVAAALQSVLAERLLQVDARPRVVDGACDGVVDTTGKNHPADAVVIATGHRLDDLIPGERRIVRPVRGEVVRIRTDDPPRRTIRGIIHGRPIYVVPRAGGEVVIGATSEEHAGEPVPTVGGVLRLLEDARDLLPTLDTADILDVSCRFRPGTPDNGPVIGPTNIRGLFAAGGHFRGGVLLAPVTALAIRACVEGGEIPDVVRAFHPNRFETANTGSNL